MTYSRQPRTKSKEDAISFIWSYLSEQKDPVPAWGSRQRTDWLRNFARQEPILDGAIFSMVSKMVSSDWRIVGGRNRVQRYHDLLTTAEDGKGWGFFIDRLVQDYLVTDMGGIVELGRLPGGPIGGIYNVDSSRCELTGNVNYPIKYYPVSGDPVKFSPLDFSRIVDMPSTDESKNGLGFCAVSRALKVSRILLSLYNYEEERLQNLPPQGIAAITGMTIDEVKEAFDLYDAMRASNEETTFRGVLWLASLDSALQNIKVELTPFSTLPEHFDKKTATELYVATVALDFGVDVREFWPVSQAGASKSEGEVQASKAKTKGPGRLYSSVERFINFDICPEGIDFKFVRKDAEEEIDRETVRGAIIRNVRLLWEPASLGKQPKPTVVSSENNNQAAQDRYNQTDQAKAMMRPNNMQDANADGATGATEDRSSPDQTEGLESRGIITTEEARALLVELEALPEWISTVPEETEYGLSKKSVRESSEPLYVIDREGKVSKYRSNAFFSFPSWLK